jgi:flagellar basal body P-ring formation protein FlgA
MRIRLSLSLLAFWVLPLTPVVAAYESHDHIQATARQHVLERAQEFPGKVEVTAESLDRRLQLGACDKPLTAYDSPNGLRPGRNAVGVRCDGDKPWKIYVSVKIATLETVVVAARPIARGQLLNPSDLETETRDTSRIHKAYYTDPKSLRGLKARRSIAAGRLLYPNLLQRRQLVKRGASVQILASQGQLQVRMKGKALDNGARGDRVRVRNLSSGREITGEVVASGMIQVQP